MATKYRVNLVRRLCSSIVVEAENPQAAVAFAEAIEPDDERLGWESERTMEIFVVAPMADEDLVFTRLKPTPVTDQSTPTVGRFFVELSRIETTRVVVEAPNEDAARRIAEAIEVEDPSLDWEVYSNELTVEECEPVLDLAEQDWEPLEVYTCSTFRAETEDVQ